MGTSLKESSKEGLKGKAICIMNYRITLCVCVGGGGWAV